MQDFRKIYLPCSCGGCGIIELIDYDDGLYGIIYYGSAFYERQTKVFEVIWNRIKFAFSILAGKEYRLFDTVIDYENYQKLKEFVNKE